MVNSETSEENAERRSVELSLTGKDDGNPKTWHCGTLVYTKAGLVTLFVFLLWGNFCFTLMQQVIPSILPIKLKTLGASNLLMGILFTSLFSLVGLFISPYLSYKSDRLRTKLGRRLPFFLGSLPFVCLSILLLAFSDSIASYLHGFTLVSRFSPAATAIAVIAVCVVIFQISDVIIASVFGYIFNDTVPPAIIGRFVGLMQVVGGACGFLYNYFIFKYAETHMRSIFIAVAVLYFLGIGLLCLFVKEGEYPPLTAAEQSESHGVAGFKTFFRESFSHKFYWTKYLFAAAIGLSLIPVIPFNIFFYRGMGLTLDHIGKAAAMVQLAGIVAAYISSIFIDRWHPLRIMVYSSVFAGIFAVSNWVWLFVAISPKAFFWLHLCGAGVIGAFHGILLFIAHTPFNIRLQPKSRYGQFCSAQSILINGGLVLSGLFLGKFFDFLKQCFHGSDYIYRFTFVWTGLCYVIAAIFGCSLYRQWHALGGDKRFHPPALWSKSGYEEMEPTPFVGVQRRWLNISLGLIRLLMLLSIAYLIPLIVWLWWNGWTLVFWWHLLLIIPLAVVIYVIWGKIERSIKADVARCAAGEPVRDGIPHHGILFIKACALHLLFAVWVGKTVVAACDTLHAGVLVFGFGNLITNALVITAVFILRRLERGHDPMLDYDDRKEHAGAGLISA